MNKLLIQHSVYIVLSLPEIQELVDEIVQLSLNHHCPRMPLCVLCFQIFRGKKKKHQDSSRSLVEVKFAQNSFTQIYGSLC